MAKIKVILTETHINLIKNIKFEKIGDYKFGMDIYNPYGGDFLFEDLAMIFGIWDKFTPGTEYDFDGKKYGYDVEKDMLEHHNYIIENIDLIFIILKQHITTGIKPGVYSTTSGKMDWKYNEK